MQYLFLFTISPVQSFIGQARKLHDLYAGSSILSTLIEKAMDKIGKKFVLFPHPYQDDSASKSYPNKFIALIDADENALMGIGESVEQTVRTAWKNIATDAISKVWTAKIASKSSLKLDFGGINEQIENHLEIHWLFEPIDSKKSYTEAFEQIEGNLGAIKNIRKFKQYTYDASITIGETGRKCSLDGERNVMFYRLSEKQIQKYSNNAEQEVQKNFLYASFNCVLGDADFRSDKNDSSDKLDPKYLQRGEGLSAVSFAKRCYGGFNNNYNEEELDENNEASNKDENWAKTFESTADIALLPWLCKIRENNGHKQLRAYRKLFYPFNAQLFFEENLEADALAKQGIRLKSGNLEQAKQALSSLNQLAKLKKLAKNQMPLLQKQSKYYCILVFDGDNMGKWVSGANCSQKGKEKLQDYQKTLASQLSKFATEAKQYLNAQSKGVAVYAGGDDFLGLVSIPALFNVLKKLRESFDTCVSKVLFDEGYIDSAMSFSAGVCIAHYKEPLNIVLARARKMQEKAKTSREKKNAYAIAVLKGSGEDHETVWGFENDSLGSLDMLVNKLYDEKVSDTFIRVFQREMYGLVNVYDGTSTSLDVLISDTLKKTEFERLLKRSLANKDDKATVESIMCEIWDKLAVNSLDYTFQNFCESLNICNFLHKNI